MLWYEKVKEKKNLLINEFVLEFGEEYRSLLEKRYDKIKWGFFISLPYLRVKVLKEYAELAADITLNFIKKDLGYQDVYIDSSFELAFGKMITSRSDLELKKLFGNRSIMFDLKDRKNTRNVKGIWAFNPELDKNYLEKCAKYLNTTPTQFLNSHRCQFLRDLQKYPSNWSDEQIINHSGYKKYCKYYELLIASYLEKLEEAKNAVEDFFLYENLIEKQEEIYNREIWNMFQTTLFPYLSIEDQELVTSNKHYNLRNISLMNQLFDDYQSIFSKSKIENMSDQGIEHFLANGNHQFPKEINVKEVIREARENACSKIRKELNQLVVIDGNVNKDKLDLDTELFETGTSFALIDYEEKQRYIFFSIYAFDPQDYDVHLRHELRHSLTSVIPKSSEDITVVKVGNYLCYYFQGNLIRKENLDFNEFQTQYWALKTTISAYQQGIYILTPQNTLEPSKITSIYDEYIPEFSKVYERLSDCCKKSQIESTNENLYREISPENIKKLEKMLRYKELIEEETIKQLLSDNSEGKSRKKQTQV